ncbi:MAG: prepilin-type N-terminal cleavage/methylation domain-containing protein [Syntrophobacteraceae bacterium]|jgi:prepilin-type N-terminal cleavage/methylation domain-containing protein
METPVCQDKGRRFDAASTAEKGFTLIEVMVTLVILAFGMLASIAGIMAGVDHSFMNEMRNEAVKIAQEQQEAARNMPYNNLPQLTNADQTVTRGLRKAQVPFTVTCTQTAAAGFFANMAACQVNFNVKWRFKDRTYNYQLQTIVRQNRQ